MSIEKCELCGGIGFIKWPSVDGLSYIIQPCRCSNINRVKTNPKKSKRGDEWTEFSFKVLNHVEEYAVPQYGDKGDDNVTDWSAEECFKLVEKYLKRRNSNQRPRQNRLDILKAAHYLCLAEAKLEDDNRQELA